MVVFCCCITYLFFRHCFVYEHAVSFSCDFFFFYICNSVVLLYSQLTLPFEDRRDSDPIVVDVYVIYKIKSFLYMNLSKKYTSKKEKESDIKTSLCEFQADKNQFHLLWTINGEKKHVLQERHGYTLAYLIAKTSIEATF